MLPKTSADCSATPLALPYRTGYAGAIDVLANYWLKRIEFGDSGEKTTPEMNLEMSASSALACFLKLYGLTDELSAIEGMVEDGYSLGLRIAAVLAQQPLNAEAPLRKLLQEFIAMLRDRRQDMA